MHEYTYVIWSEHGRVQTRFARAQMLHKQLQALLDLGANPAYVADDGERRACAMDIAKANKDAKEKEGETGACEHALSDPYGP